MKPVISLNEVEDLLSRYEGYVYRPNKNELKLVADNIISNEETKATIHIFQEPGKTTYHLFASANSVRCEPFKGTYDFREARFFVPDLRYCLERFDFVKKKEEAE